MATCKSHKTALMNKREGETNIAQELKLTQRKLQNARNLIEANDKYAKEAKQRETQSRALASFYQNKSNITLEKLQLLQLQLNIKDKTAHRKKNNQDIQKLEVMVRKLENDPSLNLLTCCDLRKSLKVARLKLAKLRREQQTQSKVLDLMLEQQASNFELRDAAIVGDKDKVGELLKRGVSVNIKDEYGVSSFEYACGNGHINVVRDMLEFADIDNNDSKVTALHLAVKRSHNNIAYLLLEYKVNLDIRDEIGMTPLHISCQNGNFDLVQALVKHGANVNYRDKNGNTCLHICAQNNFHRLADYLIQSGADKNLQNVKVMTPLEVAKSNKSKQVVQILKSIW